MIDMKKIIFVLPSLAIGGLERVQITIANALVSKGYDVTVLCLDPMADLLPLIDKRIKYIYKPYKQHHIMGKLPYVRYKFYDSGMWETRASAKKLYKYYVGNEKFDVEIAFFRGLPIKIISGSTNKFSKKIAWVHNDFTKCSGFVNNFKSIDDVKKAYSVFNKIVCVSNQAKEGFIKVISNFASLVTIYNILPKNFIIKESNKVPSIKILKSDFHFVSVGRLLDNAKGQIRLINVISKLRKEGYNVSLNLVGTGPDECKIKNRIIELKAEDYIYTVGNQINPYPYIKESDLLICSSFFEGFNLTVAEALILDVPVLSTNCTGPNEILDNGKYGIIVENSEEGLYGGLLNVLNNPSILDDLKLRAKERKDFFNENKLLNQIIGLFNE